MLRLLLLAICLAAPLHAADRKPNIIFILADDLGYGELGCFGQKLIATPHLDRMASEGMKFTRFYAGSPVCAPSRSVLMTGLHTGNTPVRGNAGKLNRTAQDLKPGTTTVAGLLKDAGYATALIGKWGIGQEGSDAAPNKKGFDYFYGYLDQHHAHNGYTDFVMRNTERVKLRNQIVPGSGGPKDAEGNSGAGIAVEPLDFVPDLMAAEALKWVETQKDKPFFLYWSLITPHANNEGTKHGRGQEIPDLGQYADKPWPAPDRAHAATITRLDADVGRLLARLKELGLDEHTLVIFSSDNGHHKEGGNDPELFDANGPLRGLKRDLYEGGIRVPTIARWPGNVRAGVEESRALWFADILPTFAYLGGAHEQLPAKLDGKSFSSLLLNLPHKPASRGDLYWEFHEAGFSQAVLMDSRWKAIRKKRLDAPIELYDLDTDPAEAHDIASGNTAMADRAKGLFQTARTESPDWPIKEAPKAKPQ